MKTKQKGNTHPSVQEEGGQVAEQVCPETKLQLVNQLAGISEGNHTPFCFKTLHLYPHPPVACPFPADLAGSRKASALLVSD